MQRIYLPHTPFSQTLCISEKDLYHQITRVMRARVGQHYVFFDGKTLQDCVYEISEIDGKKVVFILKERVEKDGEISPKLYLYQALPNKLEKLEYIVQKSCEVGYQSITFFQAQRSQILVLSENKKDRLKKIAIEAVEQCGGNIIPEIVFIFCSQDTSLQLSPTRRESKPHCDFTSPGRRGLGEVLSAGEKQDLRNNTLSLFCHTESKDAQILHEYSFRDISRVHIFVGPEGGFSPHEREMFQTHGIQAVHFGNRILRTETVAPLLGFYIAQKKQD